MKKIGTSEPVNERMEKWTFLFFIAQGVDIISGDINGISTRIHDESEANAHFMKYNQYHRQEAAYDRAVDLTGQKSADKCMDILKVGSLSSPPCNTLW